MRAIIQPVKGYVNIQAEKLREQDGYIFVYKNEELVGCFALGTVDAVYLSERKEE